MERMKVSGAELLIGNGEIHSVGPYVLGKTLGRGATGKVKLAHHRATGEKVAIKIVNKEFLNSRPAMKKKVEREIAVMKLLQHPNVLKLYDVYQTSKYLFLVLEHVEGGELFEYLLKRGNLDPVEALHIFEQMLQGLEYCHAHLICHRDLKPENLLLDNRRNIKIADFGMASLMEEGVLLDTSCGSPHYASPEVIMGKKYDGKKADVWSCGVILYALLTGSLPFDDDNIRQLLSKVKSGIFSMPQYLPHNVKDLLWRMLTVDPDQRISIAEIKQHPWLVESKSKFASNPVGATDPLSLERKLSQPIDYALDEDILTSLRCLGWEDTQSLHSALTSDQPTLQKVFYRLLEERKRGQLSRQLSHMDEDDPMDTDSTEQRETEESDQHTKSLPMQIRGNPRLQPKKRGEPSDSPIIGSTPRHWFTNFFGSYNERED